MRPRSRRSTRCRYSCPPSWSGPDQLPPAGSAIRCRGQPGAACGCDTLLDEIPSTLPNSHAQLRGTRRKGEDDTTSIRAIFGALRDGTGGLLRSSTVAAVGAGRTRSRVWRHPRGTRLDDKPLVPGRLGRTNAQWTHQRPHRRRTVHRVATGVSRPIPPIRISLSGRQNGFRRGRIRSAAPPPPALAVLRIPRLGIEVPVLEGTDDWTLNRGVGHIEDTAGLAPTATSASPDIATASSAH